MSARDKFHYAVKQGLEKEGWVITHDPLRIEFGEEDKISIDLGAEKLIAAEKYEQKIAVEVKSFLSDSAIFDFHLALGQFLNYRLVLEETEPERLLYLAVPLEAYESFFYRDLPQASIRRYQIKLIIYDSRNEVIIKWIN
ncbi:XisH family protein [Nostoc sp. FACHB-87]|uniref:XisH family protein n=1 Tax=Nostocales TaxID=1161 RepID=UPI0016889BB1|nr:MULTISPECIES: XisH family protein [Nostocales]MBD2302893.1 XisH family protein [Nostoc sp. FACHB-190]MBD2453930.1 XisH family protein [Nostoc sp. FACHB-87]MBD2476055.1 XisH family protein [Anabaena sp. FACHB-83]MBD2489722.1 XisH family protein [Aulosira sp. FACHB-615]